MKIFVLIIALISFSTTQCYIDPGTGSFIFQLFAAGLLTGLFTLKTYWASFMALFSKKK